MWIGICLPQLLWSYRSTRKRTSSKPFGGLRALQSNWASEARIPSNEMVEFEELKDEGAGYAFQVDPGRIIFAPVQDFACSRRFPTPDFSVVTIRAQDRTRVEQVVTKRESKIEPIRTILAKLKSTLKIPEDLIIQGELADLERLLS